MATFRKRGNDGRVSVQIRKKGVVKSESFRNMTLARKWAAEIEAKIDDGLQRTTEYTLYELLDEYSRAQSVSHKGVRWEQTRIERFKRELPDTPLESIRPISLKKWRNDRLEVVKPSSVRRDMALLNSVFAYAVQELEWMDSNPMRDVRKPKDTPARDAVITDAQCAALCSATGYEIGQTPATTRQVVCAALVLAMNTAMRLGEMVSLEWGDIDLSGRVARLNDTKNSDDRVVPLNKTAMTVLEGLEDLPKPLPRSRDSLSATFTALKKELGFDEIRFHDSRASAVGLLSKKLDIYQLSRVTGHRDLKMLRRYYRADMSELAAMLD